MTTLKRCRYQIKDQRGDIAFRPVTLITGDNQTGKSAVTLAITEAIAPTHGFPWSSGEAASAELLFDVPRGALQVERRFVPDHAVQINGRTTKIKDASGILAEKLGTARTLTVTSFADLTAQKKAEAVLLLATAIPEDVPRTDKALTAAVPASWWTPADKGGLGLKRPMGFEPPVFVPWVSASLSDVRAAKTAASAARKTAEEALKGLVLDTGIPTGTLPEELARREALIRERGDTEKRLGEVQRSSEAVTRLRAEIARHEEQRQAAQGALAELVTPAEITADYEVRIAEAEARVRASSARDAELEQMEADGRDLADRRARLGERVAAAREVLRAIQAVTANDECPTCGEALRAGTHAHDRLAARARVAAAELTEATGSLTEIEAQVAAARESYRVLRDAIAGEKRAAAEALRSVTSTRDAAVQSARTERARHDDAASRAEAAIEALERQIATTPMDVDPDLLTARIEGLAVEIEAADALIARLQRAQQHEVDKHSATLRKDAAADRFELAKEAEATLKGWRDAIVDPVIARLEAVAERVVTAVFPTDRLRVVLDESGKGLSLAIKRTKRGATKTIQYGGWSGVERAVAGIAAHVAMLQAEDAPWKVIIFDEAQVCAKRVFPRLVSALVALTEDGTLDNVVFVGAMEDHLPTVDRATQAKCAVVDMGEETEDDDIEEAA